MPTKYKKYGVAEYKVIELLKQEKYTLKEISEMLQADLGVILKFAKKYWNRKKSEIDEIIMRVETKRKLKNECLQAYRQYGFFDRPSLMA